MKVLKKYYLIKFLSAFVSIAIFILLATNSCAKTNAGNEPGFEDSSQNPSSSGKFYPGLETVLLPEGLPEQIKEYTGFTVSFNKDNHTPNYVAWELLGTEVSNEVSRTDNFWQDLEIEGCPAHSDYSYSGWDRGHMCPAADQKWSREAMEDCFVMTNMCPQDHDLNAGAWNTLENKERQWAKRDSCIMIIAGPIYSENDTDRIGRSGVRVPGAFFKALLAPYIEKPRAIAFVYPNINSTGNMEKYAMSIDDLETLLGYDLFPALPDDIENAVEAEFSFVEWNRSR
ncbi:MAG: DNA/RNA non-specific endonuclease [Muribaculaceae bacterium]|nr:DNA/RNA non-specific endonuclease [Muribaculaceae bacterium]